MVPPVRLVSPPPASDAQPSPILQTNLPNAPPAPLSRELPRAGSARRCFHHLTSGRVGGRRALGGSAVTRTGNRCKGRDRAVPLRDGSMVAGRDANPEPLENALVRGYKPTDVDLLEAGAARADDLPPARGEQREPGTGARRVPLPHGRSHVSTPTIAPSATPRGHKEPRERPTDSGQEHHSAVRCRDRLMVGGRRSCGGRQSGPDRDDPHVAFALVRAGRPRAIAFVPLRSRRQARPGECSPSIAIVPT